MSRKLVMAQGKSGAEIDREALGIIREYQPSVLQELSPFDVERFFECELGDIVGIDTDYRPLSIGIHGYTDSERNECIISSDLADDPFQYNFLRSTMAHEIGHALQHVPEFRVRKQILRSIHDTDHVSLKRYAEHEIPLYRNPEWQAWRYAGALLMPGRMIKLAVEKGCSVREMSRIFKVNPAFVETRLRALKIYP